MSKPRRIQRKRTKAYRLKSPNGLPVVYVGRGSQWGNPFRVGIHGTAEECVRKYRRRIQEDRKLIIKELRGKNLACWCPLDRPCHADVLLEVANG